MKRRPMDRCFCCMFFTTRVPNGIGGDAVLDYKEEANMKLMNSGWCHRHAPVKEKYPTPFSHANAWPQVFYEDWCGDFQCESQIENRK